MADWGSSGIDSFTPTTHSKPYPAIDPSKTTFPDPYVVCVLGASRGIGAGIAYAYAQAGASGLVLASRRISALHEVAAKCRAISSATRVTVEPCDITVSSDLAGLAEKIKATLGRLDVVVVNAGYSGPVITNVMEGDPQTFQQVMNVNYMGTYHAAHSLIPLLLSSPSSPAASKAFLAVGSNASFIVRGPIANTQYCVSKLAQLKLVEHIHEQYHGQGLLAAAIHPGAVMSEMAEETAPKEFMKYLTDDPALCGAFCVWLVRGGGEDGRQWLGGRHLVAKWDVDELVARKEEIVAKDLLKVRLSL